MSFRLRPPARAREGRERRAANAPYRTSRDLRRFRLNYGGFALTGQGRPAHDDHAPLGRGDEAELLVQAPHRLVPLLALGQEPPEPGLLGRRDLRAFQRSGHSSPPPVPPRGGQAVERLLAACLESRVADHLVAREGEEAELRPPVRLVDL